jgi:subtilisin-like proprotein convertase family protein
MGTATITVGVNDGQYTTSTSFVLQVTPSFVGRLSFTNATPITIPSVGAATPYPSTINVSAMGGVVSNVTMTLYGITHQRMRDVDILLVGPAGQKVIVLSDVGPGGLQGSVTLTLSDAAASPLGTATLVSGTYRPTDITTGDTFVSPAPAGPYASALSAFNAQSPKGTWSLYVVDDSSGSTGSIAGGWSITLTTMTVPPTITGIPNQGIPVDSTTGPLGFTIGDVDTPLASLTLSADSSNLGLVPVNNIVFSGSGSNRTMTVTPAAGQLGTATITVTVNDGQYSNSTSFVLTVNEPNAGLVAAYSFDEGSGTLVGDISGNGNTGTISGATWTTSGKYGNSLSFNGTGAMVRVNDSASLDLSSAMTLEAWVYPTALGGWRDVIYKGPDDIYYLMGSSSASTPAFGGTFNSAPVFGSASLTLNVWSHLAATYDGTTMRLYVNGVQVGSRAQTGLINTSTGLLTIGGDALYGQYFAGRIDEVRIYSRALGANEIQANMNSPLGGAGGAGGAITAASSQFISIENPPKIISMILDHGTIKLTVNGNAGFSYVLEASRDLVNWTRVAAQDNTTGAVVFAHQPTTNTVQFYRASVSRSFKIRN